MSQATVKRNLVRNQSYLTSLLRKLHEAHREAQELVDCPFISKKDIDDVRNVYMQLSFCIELLK